MLAQQSKFSDLFFDVSKMSNEEKEEMTKSFSLALHGEVSDLISSINFKSHMQQKKSPDKEKILYESVDVFRYLLGIMNIWGIESKDFVSAFKDKDLFLHKRKNDELKKWNGEPVLIVDIDDVIGNFRKSFFNWLQTKYDITISEDHPEYYASTPIKEKGLNPETIFKEFTSDRGMRTLSIVDGMIEVLQKAKDMGYWIQLLTARPEKNLVCLYDTYFWLETMQIPHDSIAFSGEKYIWIVQSKFYGHVAACIDDSAKHSAEYAMHGLVVFSPSLSYNKILGETKNVTLYNTANELLILITSLKENVK